jgi:hypothetical protein
MAETIESALEDELRLLKVREDELLRKNAELDSQLKQIDAECQNCIKRTDDTATMLDMTSASQKFIKPSSRKGLVTPTSARSLNTSTDISNEEAITFSKECCAFSPTLMEVTSATAPRSKTHRRSLPCTSIPAANGESQELTKETRHSTLKTELDKTKDALASRTDELAECQQHLQRQIRCVKKLESNLQEKQIKIDEYESKKAEQQSYINELNKEIQELRKEVASSQQFAKTIEADYKKNEVRMTRAIEECAKYKAALLKATEEKRLSGAISREEKDGLVKKIKALEQQRRDLLTAFKKQMKLIDVLKRQKLCIEAAKVLTMAEEEFMKVINWDKVN